MLRRIDGAWRAEPAHEWAEGTAAELSGGADGSIRFDATGLAEPAFVHAAARRTADRGARSAADGDVTRFAAKRSEQGFTLIEMLVALAIFSLAALALLRLGGATAANSARLESQAMAQPVARNVAVETLDRPRAARLRPVRRRGGQWRPALALDARRRPLARGADPADRDPRSRWPSRRARDGRRLTVFRRAAHMRRNGFTLVEMLIALTIFGMLTAAGVTLLSVTVRTQETSERLLGRARRGAAAPAPCSTPISARRRRASAATATAGRQTPSVGSNGGQTLLMALVRRGGDEESQAPNSALQRVEYRPRAGDGSSGSPSRQVDGESRAVAMPLLDGVRQVRLRYRDEEGNWREAWDPTDPSDLPRAVELVTDSEAQGQVRQLFLVGSGR